MFLTFGSAKPVARRQRSSPAWWQLLVLLPALALGEKDRPPLELQAAQHYGPQTALMAGALSELIVELQSADTDRKLKEVNRFFNDRLQFRDDMRVWNEKDYWASPLEMMAKGAGDCEDFSIAKFAVLRRTGIAVEKLRLTYVKAAIGGPGSGISQAHMVLSYYETPTSAPLILDNLISDIKPARQRPDLTPVFSFNSEGLWVGSQSQASQYDPKIKLSRWREVLIRIHNEGL